MSLLSNLSTQAGFQHDGINYQVRKSSQITTKNVQG